MIKAVVGSGVLVTLGLALAGCSKAASEATEEKPVEPPDLWTTADALATVGWVMLVPIIVGVICGLYITEEDDDPERALKWWGLAGLSTVVMVTFWIIAVFVGVAEAAAK